MGKKKYRTPKGLDEGLVPTPPRFAERDEEENVKTYRYGHTYWARGGNYSTMIVDEIHRRRKNNESVVITVTGPPGSGKTYFGIRFAQKLDPKFHINDVPAPPPNEDDSQLAFGREHLAYLTGPNSPLKRDQVIVMDESHFGVGARSWQNVDQQELTNYIAAIRSKGYVLIIVTLHTEMIDKLIRNFVINYEFYLAKRGEAIVYRRFFPQFSDKVFTKRLGRMQLMMPDEDLCNWSSCLRCKELEKGPDERCETLRAVYERRKAAFLAKRSEKKEEEQAEKNTPLPQIVIELEPHKSEIPTRVKGQHTHVYQGRLREFVRGKLGYVVSERRISPLAGLIEEATWWRSMYP